MLDNQFQFAIMATEDRIRAIRGRNVLSERGIKRIFRLPSERLSVREAGRR